MSDSTKDPVLFGDKRPEDDKTVQVNKENLEKAKDFVAKALGTTAEGAVRIVGETALVALSTAYAHDKDYGLDLYQTAKLISNSEDKELYGTFQTEFEENDLAQFLVNRLVNRLMDVRLVGPKEEREKVQNFFYAKDTVDTLQQILAQSFILGTGLLQRFGDREELKNALRLDTTSVRIEKRLNARKGEIEYFFTQETDTETTGPLDVEDGQPVLQIRKLRRDKIGMFRPVERPDTAYGMPYMKGSLLALQALRQLLKDIPAGIKRLAYATMVMKIDLSGVTTENEAKTRIRGALSSFSKYDAATTPVVGIDKENELAYVGSDGGSVPTIMPLLPIIEPIFLGLLVKWHVPLGVVLQENSNRALMVTQASEAEREIRRLQEKFARFLEKEVISYILGTPEGKRPVVRVEHNINLDDQADELKAYVEMVKEGILPVEALTRKFGIELPEEEKLHYFIDAKTFVVNNLQEAVGKMEELAEKAQEEKAKAQEKADAEKTAPKPKPTTT